MITATLWKNHLSVHYVRKKNTLKCNFCQKPFIQSSHLITDKYGHTKETQFQCSFCMNAFKSSKKSSTHKGSHTKENSFQCEFSLKVLSNLVI